MVSKYKVFALKSILRQKKKKNYGKFKYFTMQKYNLQKKIKILQKRNQSPSRYHNNTITKSQVSTQAKKNNPHIKIDLLLLLLLLLPRGQNHKKNNGVKHWSIFTLCDDAHGLSGFTLGVNTNWLTKL
jgi:hypothetical protein